MKQLPDDCDEWTAQEIFSDEETEIEHDENEYSLGKRLTRMVSKI